MSNVGTEIEETLTSASETPDLSAFVDLTQHEIQALKTR